MKKSFLLLASTLSAAVSFGALRAVTPDPYGGKTDAWQMARHAAKMREVKAGGAPVVFIGDSITHFWESSGKSVWAKYFAAGPMRALNLGTSADRTEHVLWRIGPGGELDGYEARCIVLMIGTNNSGHFPREQETPIDTIEGVRAILKLIAEKQPKARTILLPIFPRGTTAKDGCRLRNNAVNRELVKFADGRRVIWCDFTDKFMDAEGNLSRDIMPDALHPCALGYEIWASGVIPVIRACLRADPDEFIPSVWPSRTSFHPIPRDPPAASPSSAYTQIGWWDGGILATHRTAIADNGTNDFDIVWVGDSITHRWCRDGGEGVALWKKLGETYRMLNLGIGGDRTEHVLWRLENGELEGYRAKLFTVMIGTNNGGRDERGVAEGIRRIVRLIRAKHPEAKVCLLPIFPRNASAQDKLRLANARISEAVRPLADGRDILWLDFNAAFLKPDGTLTKDVMDDLLHPNAKGYEIWWRSIGPTVMSVTGRRAPDRTCPVARPGAVHSPTNRLFTGIPSLAVSPVNGRLWVTHYGSLTPGEDSNCFVPLLTSADGGESWKTVLVADPDGIGLRRTFDPQVWIGPDGKLRWTFTDRICRKAAPLPKDYPHHCAGDEGDPMTDQLMMVTLDAESEPPGEVAPARPIGRGVMMGKPLVLDDGTWLFPSSLWGCDPSACFYETTDRGATFALRGGATIPDASSRLYDEHNVVQLRNGDLWTVIRSQWKKPYLESFSHDRGRTWTTAAPARFRHTSSRLFLRRLASGNLLLVKHGPIDRDVGRRLLMAFVSEDDGASWKGGLVLDERENVSYPDGDQAKDGRIYVVYDHDRFDAQEILTATFTEDDAREGRIVSNKVRLRRPVSRRN